MTLDEKLTNFTEYCVLAAKKKSEELILQQQAALDKDFEAYTVKSQEIADTQIKIEKENLEKKLNKELSNEQLHSKQLIGEARTELTDKLFVELSDKISNFINTKEYMELISSQIEYALKFADGDELIIYVDSTDESRLHELCARHQTDCIKISEHSFMGGTKALLPKKNILIDNSFAKKLETAKLRFMFDLGGEEDV
ncbi:MAG: ATPase [Lachnospiraceae bacterium]|jgi:hypothetical protein|nr:MAG: ATPase [Lachnospiraceae bacterium]